MGGSADSSDSKNREKGDDVAARRENATYSNNEHL
jgi:hypothetical protein